MKKKFIALAMVSALSATCVFGATACNKGGDGGDKGGVPNTGDSIQVSDEAAWNAAFRSPESCTRSTTQIISYTMEGVTVTSTTSGICYMVGNEDYEITTTVADGEESTSYFYHLIEGTKTYMAHREGADGSWEVGYATTDDSDTAPYPYSSFTFENGKYVGRLVNESDDQSDAEKVEIKVTIKIGSEGYVNYLKLEDNEDGTSLTVEFTVSNINKTTYTFPEDAKQAVVDYKAEHSNN